MQLFYKKCVFFILKNDSILFTSSKRFCSTRHVPLITCKRPYLNFFSHKPSKVSEIKCASDGWFDKKSKGDFFIIKPNPHSMFDKESDFVSLGLSKEISTVLSQKKFKIPTQIQSEAIPTILSGKNSIVSAETGCGKTFAYLLPLLQQILLWKNYERYGVLNSPYGVIITPSRELAKQITEVAEPLFSQFMLNTNCVVGGHVKREVNNAKFENVDLLVGSLGALKKYFTQEVYNTHRTHHIVIDEADTLLDDSFSFALSGFLNKFNFQYELSLPPKGCQCTMVSATMPKEIPDCVTEFLNIDSLKYLTTPRLHKINSLAPQRFLRMGKSEKSLELLKLIKSDISKKIPVMVFSNDTATSHYIYHFLSDNGIESVHFHKDMSAEQKAEMYDKFKSGQVNIISCTDMGSRGLDTTKTKHVINFDFPNFTADYIHRCGRTGRIGSPPGCRITNFISSRNEVELVRKIEYSIRASEELPHVDGNITKVIENYWRKRRNMKST